MNRRSLRSTLPTHLVRRSYPVAFEVRDTTGGTVELVGYASTTEQPYPMRDLFGEYAETIRRGAFTATLASGPDVALLVNHGGLTMARTAAGTLHLTEDDRGLRAVAEVNPTRTDVADLLKAIQDGAVDQMSFGFRVNAQSWSPDFTRRDITAIDLDRGDVSVVNFGANPTTSVSVARTRTRSQLALALRCR